MISIQQSFGVWSVRGRDGNSVRTDEIYFFSAVMGRMLSDNAMIYKAVSLICG